MLMTNPVQHTVRGQCINVNSEEPFLPRFSIKSEIGNLGNLGRNGSSVDIWTELLSACPNGQPHTGVISVATGLTLT